MIVQVFEGNIHDNRQKNVSNSEAKKAQKFIDFLTKDEQQIIFANYGFRPINNLELKSLSPWNQNIEGVEINPSVTVKLSPTPEIINEIQKVWYRSN
ncbi:hypothetical protein ACN4EE_01910 [Geminocystis sp. CENA526]|uniref:hypothetical protein n=1 Tax=Geminocystis sp. CENA526 TaxID=1355871 RepID=UPI003D6EF67A